MPAASDLIHANAGRLLGEMLDSSHGSIEREGDSIGPYCLVSRLGEGGFGTVWRAEQTGPVRRDVALKLIKLGMDTVQVLNRFNQERQALASLDHPCIATMLDAGVSPDGRPYFAMELVKGEPITRWCHSHQLPIPERLRIFSQVCHAVHHAHQKGIIHRDLNPNNILVTSIDSRPTPKIIDFGIAKAVSSHPLSGETMLTQADQMLGTPVYMSPEQIEGKGSIDIRSDIYSLGVVLYQLLTDVLPFDSATTLAETSRRMREKAPQRPSTQRRRIKRLTRGKSPAQSTFDDLFPSYSSDLDWITMRALDRDCNRRYQSAAEFAADIERFLLGEPILARPPSFAYVSSRWIKRHRTAFAAVCLVALAMLVGTTLALWQAKAARISQHLAETEAAHARDARQQAQQTAVFVTDLLDRVSQEVNKGRNPEALKAALVDSDQQILKLSTDPQLRIDLLERIQNIYSLIGETKLAIPLAKAKADELGRLYGRESESALDAELTYIKSVVDFGARASSPSLLEDLKRRVEAGGGRGSQFWLEVQRNLSRAWIKLDHPENGLAAADELIAEATSQKLTPRAMVANQIAHAAALEFAGKFPEALNLLEEARQAADPKHLKDLDRRVIYLFQRKKDYHGGAELMRKRVTEEQAKSGARAATLIPLLLLLGEFGSKAGNHAEAIAHCEVALAIAREQLPADDSATHVQRKGVWQALVELANRESAGRRYSAAINHAQQALKLAQGIDNHDLITRSLRNLGDFYRDAGDLESAFATKLQSYERVREFGANQRDSEQDLLEMCNIRLEQGRLDEAMKLGLDLWAEIQSRPESQQDPGQVGEAAEKILNCYTALKAAKPSTPEPQELTAWLKAAEQFKRLDLVPK